MPQATICLFPPAFARKRAAQKYGEDQDWSAWQFRAEPVPRGSGDVVRSAWRDGAFVRL